MMNFPSRFLDTATTTSALTPNSNNSNSSQMTTTSAGNSGQSGTMTSMMSPQPYVLVPYAMFQEMSGASQGQGFQLANSGDSSSNTTGSSSGTNSSPTMSGTMTLPGNSGNQYVLQGNFYNPIFSSGSPVQFSQGSYLPVNQQQQQQQGGTMQMMPSEPMASGDAQQPMMPPMVMMMPYAPYQYAPQGNYYNQGNNNQGQNYSQPQSDTQNQPQQPYMHRFHHHFMNPQTPAPAASVESETNEPDDSSTDTTQSCKPAPKPVKTPPAASVDPYATDNTQNCKPAPKPHKTPPAADTTPQEPVAPDEPDAPDDTQNCTPAPAPAPAADSTPTPAPCPTGVFGDGDGSYEGDPHLVGFDGEKYDVMGTAGNTYNMISDKNFQYNTNFIKMGAHADSTAIGSAGLLVGKDQLSLDATKGTPTLNGKALDVNKKTTLADGKSTALWDGTTFKVDSPEYEVGLKISTDSGSSTKYLDSTVKLLGSPFADNVKPHGLLGQTADGIAGAKNSGVDRGDQGGTVIDGVVGDYQVKDLFDTSFKNFNRFTG